jgi:hypothetical protein
MHFLRSLFPWKIIRLFANDPYGFPELGTSRTSPACVKTAPRSGGAEPGSENQWQKKKKTRANEDEQ